MPIPSSITQDRISRWDATFEELRQNPPHGIPPGFLNTPGLKEKVHYPGEWLAEELGKLGLDQDQISAVCFANGQRIMHAPDSWEVTQQTLSRARAGEFDTPGIELARELLDQSGLSEPANAKAVREAAGITGTVIRANGEVD